MAEMDEAEAIKRCRDGDSGAFRHLVQQYQQQALSHSISLLRNREDALDATQEAFLDAFQALNRFDTTRPFYPWFYVLLRNRCFKMIAKRKSVDSLENAEILAAPSPGAAAEERLALESALHALGAEVREVVMLRYLDGLSYQELSERLCIPRGTVMSRLFYARRRLNRLLSDNLKKEQIEIWAE